MMEQDSIGLVVAMAQEVRPIVRQLGAYRKGQAGRFPTYHFRLDGRPVTLIQSGMGTEQAAAATEQLIAATQPRLLISAGLGGGVRAGLTTGDVVVAGQLLALRHGSIADAGTLANGKVLHALAETFPDAPFRIADGTMITTCSIVNKGAARQLLANEVLNPVLDMETSAVALVASRTGIPLIAVRAISDAAEEELLFSLEEITDRQLNIRIGKVLVAMAKNPRIVPQLIRLAKNSKLAGSNLALVLDKLVRIA
jgi:adenosylhomocysteine nucleosidase